MAQPDQANALPQRLPLRLVVPAGAAVVAVLLVTALVVPSLVGGGGPAGTGGPLPGGSAQFDAAINHGNSGGPVLDSSGRVVAR